MAEAFFSTTRAEILSESETKKKTRGKSERLIEQTMEAQRETGEDSAAKAPLSSFKHVRYVLEEDTKDDSWSSSFAPQHSSGPASKLFIQPVPAAATSAAEVSQQPGARLHVQVAA